jgi:hypothetical protein
MLFSVCLKVAVQKKRELPKVGVKRREMAMASDDEWEDLKAGAEKIWYEVKVILRDIINKTS